MPKTKKKQYLTKPTIANLELTPEEAFKIAIGLLRPWFEHVTYFADDKGDKVEAFVISVDKATFEKHFSTPIPQPKTHGYGCPHDGDPLTAPQPKDCPCDADGNAKGA